MHREITDHSVAEQSITIPNSSTPSTIVKATGVRVREELDAEWRASRCVLEDVHVVDRRHLVYTFFVNHAAAITRTHASPLLTKYVDTENHAPYCAEHLKLATLRHYREHHRSLEGTCDPMEGRCIAKSSLDEFLDRHGVSDIPHGAHHVPTAVTYQTEDTSWIYCTSLTRDAPSRHEHWRVACHIRDAPRFAVLLGAEFARQRNNERHAPVTGLDWLCDGSVRCSGLESAVQVHHGPVVYDDNVAEAIFGRMPHHARVLAAHFFKGKAFRDQREYRFVLHGVGGRPLLDELYLRITPDLRRAFRKP